MCETEESLQRLIDPWGEVRETEESLQGLIDPWGEVCETDESLQGLIDPWGEVCGSEDLSLFAKVQGSVNASTYQEPSIIFHAVTTAVNCPRAERLQLTY